ALAQARQQGALITALTPALKPKNNLPLAAWYRATRTDSIGGDIISGGDAYVLRLRPTQVEMVRFLPIVDAGNNYSRCAVAAPGFDDGNWHHLAGVAGPAGMKVYFDGVE